MDNINDRKTLIILEHKESKSISDKRKIKKLAQLYPDNHLFEDDLINELVREDLLTTKGDEKSISYNENGDPIFKAVTYITTQSGLLMLRSFVFASEYRNYCMDKSTKTFERIASIAAIVTAVISLLSLFRENFINFIESFIDWMTRATN